MVNIFLVFIFLSHCPVYGEEKKNELSSNEKIAIESQAAIHLNHEKDQLAAEKSPTHQNTSSTFMENARLNGKIGVGVLGFYRVAFPLLLEFENPIIKFQNQKLMWLLQGGVGFTIKEKRKGGFQWCPKGICGIPFYRGDHLFCWMEHYG